MTTRSTIVIRTSYAGCENSKQDLKKAASIAKKFRAKCGWGSDKGYSLEIADEAGFRRAMSEAKIDYLIQDAGE